MTETKGQPPIKKFRSYPMEVAIWKFADRDTGYPRYSMKLTKQTTDKDTTQYVERSFLNPTDAAVASNLLSQAFAYTISLPSEKLSPASQPETEGKDPFSNEGV